MLVAKLQEEKMPLVRIKNRETILVAKLQEEKMPLVRIKNWETTPMARQLVTMMLQIV